MMENSTKGILFLLLRSLLFALIGGIIVGLVVIHIERNEIRKGIDLNFTDTDCAFRLYQRTTSSTRLVKVIRTSELFFNTMWYDIEYFLKSNASYGPPHRDNMIFLESEIINSLSEGCTFSNDNSEYYFRIMDRLQDVGSNMTNKDLNYYFNYRFFRLTHGYYSSNDSDYESTYYSAKLQTVSGFSEFRVEYWSCVLLILILTGVLTAILFLISYQRELKASRGRLQI